MFVHKSIMGPFLAQLVERTKRMKIGDPFHEDTTVGATISKQQFDIVMRYIELAKKEVYIKDICSLCSQIPSLGREIENMQQIRFIKSFQMLHVFTIMILKINDSLNLPSRLYVPYKVLVTVMNFSMLYHSPFVHLVDFCFCVCREPVWCVVGRE